MTLLIFLSIFFIYLDIREFIPNKSAPRVFDGFSVFYIATLLCLAFFCAWTPYKYWKLESFLSKNATEIAKVDSVNFHCNSFFESIFYENYSYGSFTMAGLAFIEEKKIIFQYPWCKHLMNYLESPEKADKKQQFSLPLFTHEVMHIRGERNEQKTECQAVKLNYEVAKKLGIPNHIAKEHAIHHARNIYPRHTYFSKTCDYEKEMRALMKNRNNN